MATSAAVLFWGTMPGTRPMAAAAALEGLSVFALSVLAPASAAPVDLEPQSDAADGCCCCCGKGALAAHAAASVLAPAADQGAGAGAAAGCLVAAERSPSRVASACDSSGEIFEVVAGLAGSAAPGAADHTLAGLATRGWLWLCCEVAAAAEAAPALGQPAGPGAFSDVHAAADTFSAAHPAGGEAFWADQPAGAAAGAVHSAAEFPATACIE